MNRLILNATLSFVVTVVMFSGCSGKEDRTSCPCRMVLDFSRVDTAIVDGVHINVVDGSGTVFDRIAGPDDFFPEYCFSVPRSEQHLNVYNGENGQFIQEKGLFIPLGAECPQVYMYTATVDTYRETVREVVMMKKNHCVVSIEMEKAEELGYGLRILGNICGYDIRGLPLKGDFAFAPTMTDDGKYKAVVPRQTDDSLVLEIEDGSAVIKSFALGEYISAGGYDWDAESLEDISVQIDWASTHVKFIVQGWDWVNEYEIVL